MMKILLLAALASAAGMAYVFGRRFSEARLLGEEELVRRLAASEPLFSGLRERTLDPAVEKWREKFAPAVRLKKKALIAALRSVLAKASAALARIDGYLGEKSGDGARGNGNPGYWSDIGEFKLKNGADRGPERPFRD